MNVENVGDSNMVNHVINDETLLLLQGWSFHFPGLS